MDQNMESSLVASLQRSPADLTFDLPSMVADDKALLAVVVVVSPLEAF